jgi:hypothetical protein
MAALCGVWTDRKRLGDKNCECRVSHNQRAPLPLIPPVIPRLHPGLTPLSLPNLHHLSMLLLNKRNQLSILIMGPVPRTVQILGELYDPPCRVCFRHGQLRYHKVAGSQACKECIQIRQRSSKANLSDQNFAKRCNFSHEGVKQAT